jgi:hypothetical protein
MKDYLNVSKVVAFTLCFISITLLAIDVENNKALEAISVHQLSVQCEQNGGQLGDYNGTPVCQAKHY